MKEVLPILCLAALITASGAAAHHSFPAVYDMDRRIRIEGTVTEFLWRNPHPYIFIEISKGAQAGEIWAIELVNTAGLNRLGVTSEAIQPGDGLIAEGNPARNGRHVIGRAALQRPSDGWSMRDTSGGAD